VTASKSFPLGGLGEFGMNCAALRFGSDMILIDAGMAFPRGEKGLELGVQIIVPDTTFLKENRDQLRALILTHGHEDHAARSPSSCRIWTSRFTAAPSPWDWWRSA
jgi:ribonuclease J